MSHSSQIGNRFLSLPTTERFPYEVFNLNKINILQKKKLFRNFVSLFQEIEKHIYKIQLETILFSKNSSSKILQSCGTK